MSHKNHMSQHNSIVEIEMVAKWYFHSKTQRRKKTQIYWMYNEGEYYRAVYVKFWSLKRICKLKKET